MPVKKLKEYLDRNGVRYVSIIHSPAFTAQEIAAISHVPGRKLAKTVIVKIDGSMAMAVLPASFDIDFDHLKEHTGADMVVLATEEEFRNTFPDCDTGAMPPFGNLYGMEVFAAEILAHDEEIAFNAGSHTELISMPYREFERLVRPTIISFAHKVIA